MSPESIATLTSTAVIATATVCYYLFSPSKFVKRERPKGTSLGEFLNSLTPQEDQ